MAKWRVLPLFAGIVAGLGLVPGEAAQEAGKPADLQAMRAPGCEAADQIMQAPLEQTIGREGFLYECEALPADGLFTVYGRLQVRGTGGPTQAQYFGKIKPAPSGRPQDWTFCELSFNGKKADLPEC